MSAPDLVLAGDDASIPKPHPPQKILVVDDMVANLRVYEAILRKIDDVEVTSYASSALAFVWAAESKPDLVIVDYHMPSPNGLEFIEMFRKRDTETPLVMLTGSSDTSVRHKALDVGADDFLNKPADPVEFLARARNLLKLRARGKQLQARSASLEREVDAATENILARERETILRLSLAVEHRDNDTAGHITRMGHYCRLLAHAAGIPYDRSELFLIAAPMHDVGKVAVPDHILLKRDTLTPDEWVIMKSHARVGYEILKGSESPLIQLAAEIALAHHEKFDGSGYPGALIAEEIPISGRICAIADVFDALVSARPYKPAWDLPRAIDALKRGRSAHFDPRLVDLFLERMPEVQAVRRAHEGAAVL